MTDVFDRASEQEEFTRQQALIEQKRRAGLVGFDTIDSANFCFDCDEPIPEKRREAMPGCERCIDCQGLQEKDRIANFYQR